MISLSSEMTDAKGSRAPAGWLFFDGDCSLCTAWGRRICPVLEHRGFGLAPLQSPRVRALLNRPEAELLREMRLLLPDGTLLGGADAVVYLARRIWWVWPLFAMAQIPGFPGLLARAYRWVANHRPSPSAPCAVTPGTSGLSRFDRSLGGSR